MTVAPAALDDASAIARVHVRSWQAAYAGILDAGYLQGLSVDERAARWRANLGSGASHTLVARVDGEVLAFVSHGACRDDGAPPDRGEVWALYVDPAAWGQGLGRALMDAALQAQREAGRTATSLWVLSANARGRRFYAACGFEAVVGSEKRFALGGREVEELCLLRRHGA